MAIHHQSFAPCTARTRYPAEPFSIAALHTAKTPSVRADLSASVLLSAPGNAMPFSKLQLFLALLLSALALGSRAGTPAAPDSPAPPLEVQSREAGDLTAADISGVIDQRFALLAPVLADAARWSAFLPMSI